MKIKSYHNAKFAVTGVIWLSKQLLVPPMMTKLASLQISALCVGQSNPDNKIHGANMVSTWVLTSAPDGSHVGPMNLAIREL